MTDSEQRVGANNKVGFEGVRQQWSKLMSIDAGCGDGEGGGGKFLVGQSATSQTAMTLTSIGGGSSSRSVWEWEAASGPGRDDPFKADWKGWDGGAGP